MAIGDAALAAGMAIVDPATGLVKNGAQEINLTRDYVAERTTDITPISRGGTAATTAAAARTSLGVPALNSVVLNGAPGVNTIRFTWAAGRLQVRIDSTDIGPLAWLSDVDSRLSTSGGTIGGNLTVNGHVYVPNAVAATAGYVVAYLNSDGRLSRGASSRRWKKRIRPAAHQGDLFALPLSEFQLRDGDGTDYLGYIAEDFADTPALARFVTRDAEGLPEGIDHIQLLLAQTAALAARVAALEGDH